MLVQNQGSSGCGTTVAKHLPDFGQHGKHGHGLRTADAPGRPDAGQLLGDYEDGPEQAWKRIWALKPQAEPEHGSSTRTWDSSCWESWSSKWAVRRPRVFAASHFRPLGMVNTGFLPGDDLRRGPPPRSGARPLDAGEVHDPRAYRWEDCRPRGLVLHGGRPGRVRSDAPGRRLLCRRPGARRADRGGDDGRLPCVPGASAAWGGT